MDVSRHERRVHYEYTLGTLASILAGMPRVTLRFPGFLVKGHLGYTGLVRSIKPKPKIPKKENVKC